MTRQWEHYEGDKLLRTYYADHIRIQSLGLVELFNRLYQYDENKTIKVMNEDPVAVIAIGQGQSISLKMN